MNKFIEKVEDIKISDIGVWDIDTLALIYFGDGPATEFMIKFAKENGSANFIINTILVATIEGGERWWENLALITNSTRRTAKDWWLSTKGIPQFIKSEEAHDIGKFQIHADTKTGAYNKYWACYDEGVILLKEAGIQADFQKLNDIQKDIVARYGYIYLLRGGATTMKAMATKQSQEDLWVLLWTTIQWAFNDTDDIEKSYRSKVAQYQNMPISACLLTNNHVKDIDYTKINKANKNKQQQQKHRETIKTNTSKRVIETKKRIVSTGSK